MGTALIVELMKMLVSRRGTVTDDGLQFEGSKHLLATRKVGLITSCELVQLVPMDLQNEATKKKI